jgi:uncharacterized protein YecE (DUF72 family)
MLYVGTSGYSFKEWVGSFYPVRTPAGKFLSVYAARLRTVEINYTFRRFPATAVSSSWARETPESFRFSLKMHQSITHVARLKDVSSSVRDFLSALEPLGPRLGIILFQLPPYLPADLKRLKNLLDELPRDRRFAFEFRHPSWKCEEVTELLRTAGAALCLAEVEVDDEISPPTAPHAYVRLRKVPPFTQKEMTIIRQKIKKILKQVDELYFYIKHDVAGISPQVAKELQEEP